jgi:hypothetical protein
MPDCWQCHYVNHKYEPQNIYLKLDNSVMIMETLWTLQSLRAATECVFFNQAKELQMTVP